MTTVGVGAVSGVSAEEVLAAIDAVLPRGARDVRVVTLDSRAHDGGIRAAAARRGWLLSAHPAGVLASVPVPSPSAAVAGHVGTPSVAEAAALADGGRLLVGKTVRGRVTVAVAT
jgi:cobalamin biosynthesis protein CbiG